MLNKELEKPVESHEQQGASHVFMFFCGTLIVLAAFQSGSMVSLSYDLPQSVWAEQVVSAAETWHGWMQAIGLAGITEVVSNWVEALHGLKIAN